MSSVVKYQFNIIADPVENGSLWWKLFKVSKQTPPPVTSSLVHLVNMYAERADLPAPLRTLILKEKAKDISLPLGKF